MSKKILMMVLIIFMVIGIVISIANFTAPLDASVAKIEGWWYSDPTCARGWRCSESDVITCFSNSECS